MRKILLVEPDYRSKFPPLGLMRISSYHKMRGDRVTFVRGKDIKSSNDHWDRVYISSLFTWELPRTLETVKYYTRSVERAKNVYVGGVAASLLPSYLRENSDCTVVEGLLDKSGQLDPLSKPVSFYPLDYGLMDSIDYPYQPKDAYFCKVTIGCVRKCTFCAVPRLEPTFGMSTSLASQVKQIETTAGEKQSLVFLDNNVLGIDGLEDIFAEIRDLGFATGSKRNGKIRNVDFNQGIDARLITPEKAHMLASVNLSPVRLAFDHDGIEKPYRRAIELLAKEGLNNFTNYLLFNFMDAPQSLFKRIQVNMELNTRLGVRITGFPMRFIPMDDVKRGHIGPKWHWRWLRGMQCVLLSTKGLVSPNPSFVSRSFGDSVEEFLEILSMPDRYIIWRKNFEFNGADQWRREYRSLSETEKAEFLEVLRLLNKSRNKKKEVAEHFRFRNLLEHYYPGGNLPVNKPTELELTSQGLSTGYDVLSEDDLIWA